MGFAYIPHYANASQCESSIPYRQRDWLPELRTDGCHRVVLAEEIAKGFLSRGVGVNVLELDTTFEAVHVRKYQGF